MALQITFTEAFTIFAEKAKAYLLSPIPNKERLAAILERSRQELNELLGQLRDAKAAVIKINNKLPALEERLNDLNEKGREWTGELQLPDITDPRKQQLNKQISNCAAECERIQTEIEGLRNNLSLREKTARIHQATYDKEQAEYQKLQRIGPTLIAQTEALEQAEAQRMAALKTATDQNDTNIGSILQELQDSMDTAQASYDAVTEMEESEPSMDLDAVLAAETHDDAISERIKSWGQP